MEEAEKGMRAGMEWARSQKEEVTHDDLDLSDHAEVGKRSGELWRALKSMREGEPQRIILRTQGDNGFEAWRRLQEFYEPNAAVCELSLIHI